MAETNIYMLIDPRDGQPKYIGKADNVKKRLGQHITYFEKSKKSNWIKSLQKCGLLPLLEIIDIVNKLEWEFWEQHYISLYRSWGFNLKNMTIGGDGVNGYKMTPQQIENNRQRAIGNTYRKGSVCSEETKRVLQISAIRQFEHQEGFWKGKKLPSKTVELIRQARLRQRDPRKGTGKPVVQYNLAGEVVNEWINIAEAEKQLKIFQIVAVCKNRRKTAGGFMWKYKSEIK